MGTSTAGQGNQVHLLVLLKWIIHEWHVICSFLATDQETKADSQVITKKKKKKSTRSPLFFHSAMPIWSFREQCAGKNTPRPRGGVRTVLSAYIISCFQPKTEFYWIQAEVLTEGRSRISLNFASWVSGEERGPWLHTQMASPGGGREAGDRHQEIVFESEYNCHIVSLPTAGSTKLSFY